MATVLNTLLGRTAKKGKKAKKQTQKKKGKVATVKTVSTTKSNTDMKHDNVDVRKEADITKLMDLIQKNKIVIVLVYADWCGHCTTFKEDIWKKLSTMPNRKVPMAAVNEKVFQSTPLSSSGAKVDGYPTVLMMGNDMKPAVFKNEQGESTTAMPNTRDLEMMKTIVTKDPDSVLEEPEAQSVVPTPEAEEKLNNAGEEAMNTLSTTSQEPPALTANPPDAEDDLLSTQETQTPSMPPARPLDSVGMSVTGAATKEEGQEGGSLYYAMLEAAKEIAPAAALAGTAVYLDRRAKSAKRARKAAVARRRATAKKLREMTVTGAV